MDLDEEVYRKGEWKVRCMVKRSHQRAQGGCKVLKNKYKENLKRNLEAMSSHIANLVEENPDLMLV